MPVSYLPSLNAFLNGVATFFLIFGFVAIKQKHAHVHKRLMLAALFASALFLTFYLIYHAQVGSVGYPHYDWTRPLYFAILIPHIIMAAVMVPFIFALVWLAFNKRFHAHKQLARWVWPVWIYVSISGVTIYVMLYHL
ncbi:DUF420 domain-containing protein [candidate division KSB1 bacterium]|nr:DUF420 domain-containing protein [candidate division KSB1 bacterium]